jgi:hypothetical protein
MELNPKVINPSPGPTSPATSFSSDAIVVLIIAWVARGLFMLLVTPLAQSTDAHNWETLANILNSGDNPYHATDGWPGLNWPPFWMQIVFVLSKISSLFSLPFFRVLQLFLIAVESVVMVFLLKLIREVAPDANARLLVILGIALNPAAILLNCQHCNFDVIVALWLVLFMLFLLRYHRTANDADWLAACLFLGLGILTKTVPLVLVPMLAGGFRRMTTLSKSLGSFLLLEPVALGMSVIFVLFPADVIANVLKYRSISNYFGVSGLFHIAGMDSLTPLYNHLFNLLLFTTMAATAIAFWRRPIEERKAVLFAALLLAAIPALGPGYGPQYLYWSLPFLVATCAFFKGPWRAVLIGFGLIAACTYLFEYAILGSDGAALINILVYVEHDQPDAVSVVKVIGRFQDYAGQTIMRLPLFAAYLVLLTTGAIVLLRRPKDTQQVSSQG